LIVDDVDFILDLLKRHLKCEGHNILSSSCGDSGRQLVKKHQVGVIISDQSMTGNGTLENDLDAINQLKILAT
jgi:DNA-binding NtrC family response regulator